MENNLETTEEAVVEGDIAEEVAADSAKMDITTAFVVAIDANNRVYLELNPGVLNIEVTREATLIEVRRYLSEILMDLQAQAAAEYTVSALTSRVAQPEAEETTAE